MNNLKRLYSIIKKKNYLFQNQYFFEIEYLLTKLNNFIKKV